VKTRPLLTAKCYDKKGRLLSTATNNYNKTHPLQKYFAERVGHKEKIYLHAEIAAIIKAGDKKIYKIKIERYSSRTGKALNAAPCPICREAIRAFGIQIVQHTIG
jgi:hypothetical protein